MRGNLKSAQPNPSGIRAIPACAGEPLTGRLSAPMSRGHPRVCGGTRVERRYQAGAGGPSPRVRGNHDAQIIRRAGRGAIPACAGEPFERAPVATPLKGHPRVCGGTAMTISLDDPTWGPSPRVRGSRRDVLHHALVVGAIPACAGEPPKALASVGHCAGHPRVCGGTPDQEPVRDAGAGHPRVCGGTSRLAPVKRPIAGPSPRVRGNHHNPKRSSRKPGAIPACAGEPYGTTGTRRPSGGHPRVCGGTQMGRTPSFLRLGPSPRVRGNQVGNAGCAARGQAIPACAGEPGAPRRSSTPRGGHPRVCGGTTPHSLPPALARGPSPRVRGNLDTVFDLLIIDGAIPACAGEP